MRIQCPKCQHHWEQDLGPADRQLVCPSCGFTAAINPPPSAPTSDQQATSVAPPRQVSDDMPTSVAAEGRPPATPPSPAGGKKNSRASSGSSAASQSPKNIDLSGQTIGGYRVTRMLGAGGMGAVCLARQVSLDRQVALKILPSGMAKNPDFLMRFTREALSAAQMTHHNIIQIYDIGHANDIHFISMEFVRGQTLNELVRSKGRLDPREAAGYILQAARGLEYAHGRNIIHRDIKPDNLMLNELGVVKIADMGLAKIRSETSRSESSERIDVGQRDEALQRARGDLTMSDVAMGTPAYMPPEQARDASTVDHRADQYSLGCTLFHLVTGKPPFTGSTAYDLINKHIAEPAPELGRDIPGAPAQLNEIIQRMLAKDPDDRYPDTSAVIAALETFLGLSDPRGAKGPTSQHIEVLDEARQEFYGVPAKKMLTLALLGYFGALFLLILFFAAVGRTEALANLIGKDGGRDLVVALLSLVILSPIVNFIVDGVLNKTFLFKRLRSVLASLSKRTWAFALGGALLLIFIFGSKLIFGLIAALGASVLYQMAIKRPLWTQRRAPLDKVRQMLREIRLMGLSEDALQEFVARNAGDEWEEFFEGLFGYESLLRARERWGLNEAGKPRRRFATWREPITQWLERVEGRSRENREKRQLQDAEAVRLRAQGMDSGAAQQQAAIEASRIMRHGFRETDGTPSIPVARERIESAPAPAANRKEPKIRYGREGSRAIFEMDQWVRLWTGLALCSLFGVTSFLGINPIPDALQLRHYNDELGLVAGLMLMISAFSSRKGTSMMILVGAIVMIAAHPIAGLINNPSLSGEYIMGIGVLCVLGGFFLPVLARVTGGRY